MCMLHVAFTSILKHETPVNASPIAITEALGDFFGCYSAAMLARRLILPQAALHPPTRRWLQIFDVMIILLVVLAGCAIVASMFLPPHWSIFKWTSAVHLVVVGSGIARSLSVLGSLRATTVTSAQWQVLRTTILFFRVCLVEVIFLFVLVASYTFVGMIQWTAIGYMLQLFFIWLCSLQLAWVMSRSRTETTANTGHPVHVGPNQSRNAPPTPANTATGGVYMANTEHRASRLSSHPSRGGYPSVQTVRLTDATTGPTTPAAAAAPSPPHGSTTLVNASMLTLPTPSLHPQMGMDPSMSPKPLVLKGSRSSSFNSGPASPAGNHPTYGANPTAATAFGMSTFTYNNKRATCANGAIGGVMAAWSPLPNAANIANVNRFPRASSSATTSAAIAAAPIATAATTAASTTTASTRYMIMDIPSPLAAVPELVVNTNAAQTTSISA